MAVSESKKPFTGLFNSLNNASQNQKIVIENENESTKLVHREPILEEPVIEKTTEIQRIEKKPKPKAQKKSKPNVKQEEPVDDENTENEKRMKEQTEKMVHGEPILKEKESKEGAEQKLKGEESMGTPVKEEPLVVKKKVGRKRKIEEDRKKVCLLFRESLCENLKTYASIKRMSVNELVEKILIENLDYDIIEKFKEFEEMINSKK